MASSGYYLQGSGTPIGVSGGGTGTATTTAYAVLCGGTDSTAALQSIASVGTSGQVLTSNGAGALPSFQAAGGFSYGASISGTTADGVTITLSNSSNDAAGALKLIAGNTQSNQPVLANLQLGTSGNVMGMLIQGTGGTTGGAAGTGKNHITLWANVDSSSARVINFANGTTYTEHGYISAWAQLRQEPAGDPNGNPLIYQTLTNAPNTGGIITSDMPAAWSNSVRGYDLTSTMAGTTLVNRTLSMFRIDITRDVNGSATKSDNYDMAHIVRRDQATNASANFTVAGSVLKVEHASAQTAGTLADTVVSLKVINDSTVSTGDIAQFMDGSTVHCKVTVTGSVVVGAAALATNATNGFLYIPTCAGTPSGTPTTQTGTCAMVFDTTNNKLYIYDGSWLGGTVPGAFV